MAREIQPLTALRGLAALWVAIFHGVIMTAVSYAGDGNAQAPRGQLPGTFGVDIFFVLSGFVMTHVYGGDFARSIRVRDYGAFLYKRFARIYPAFFAALTVFAVLAVANFLRPGLLNYPEHYPFATLAAQYLLIQVWGIVNGAGWIVSAWSISAELFAYLLFPFAALFLGGRRSLFLAAAVALACIFYIRAPYWQLYGYPALIRVVWEFGAGMLLRRWWDTALLRLMGRDGAIILWIVLAVLFLLLALPRGAPEGLFLVFAALIVGGLATNRGRMARLLSRPEMLYLGRISYPLYLMQTLALLVAGRAARAIGAGLAGNLVFWTCYTVLCLGLAVLVHHGIETPARRFLVRSQGLHRGIPRPS